MLSISELGKINFKDDSSRLNGYMEGSNISFYCRDDGNKPVYIVATCMENGSWSPDPHTYKCQKEDETSITLITSFPYIILIFSSRQY
jgi:hypothetical protein